MKPVENPLGQVFALASNCDATQLSLTAPQGYLFSRIDGATPWRLLREMGGLPVEEADSCLTQWIEEGLIEIVSHSSPSVPEASRNSVEAPSGAGEAAEPEATSVLPIQIDESEIDDQLDLAVEAQRRILEFETRLGLSYDQLLDVPIGSNPKVVKRAYFGLSKEFHPDRYFRKEIGRHAPRLERIFKKILEAYEILSDPDLCQIENQREPVDETGKDAATEESADASPKKPKQLSKLERLRQRMPFKIDHVAIAARHDKAQEIFRAAESSLNAGRLSEAEASIRIAISFDPGRTEFKEALGSLRIRAAGNRATKLLKSPSERMSDGDLREGLTLLEDILIYRPHDPELNERAAQICLQLGKHELAKSYVETLIERISDSAEYYSLAGKIYRELNEVGAAVHAFEMALKLDGENLDARRALASVRIGARNIARGGTS